MNKLERKAEVLGLKDEFKQLIVPYISKEAPYTLSEMPRTPSNLIPNYNLRYKPSKFLRDIMVKEIPPLLERKPIKINVTPAEIILSNLTNTIVEPIVEAKALVTKDSEISITSTLTAVSASKRKAPVNAKTRKKKKK